MSFNYYILENGEIKLATLEEWSKWFEKIELRRVSYTELSPDIFVSTICLGLDHNFFGTGPPLLFETMAFGVEDEICHRAATLEEAKETHRKVVEEVTEIYG